MGCFQGNAECPGPGPHLPLEGNREGDHPDLHPHRVASGDATPGLGMVKIHFLHCTFSKKNHQLVRRANK